MAIKLLPLEWLTTGLSGRIDIGDICELAASIYRHGLIEPILIDSEYRIIDGARRYFAYKLLAHIEGGIYLKIPCEIVEVEVF